MPDSHQSHKRSSSSSSRQAQNCCCCFRPPHSQDNGCLPLFAATPAIHAWPCRLQRLPRCASEGRWQRCTRAPQNHHPSADLAGPSLHGRDQTTGGCWACPPNQPTTSATKLTVAPLVKTMLRQPQESGPPRASSFLHTRRPVSPRLCSVQTDAGSTAAQLTSSIKASAGLLREAAQRSCTAMHVTVIQCCTSSTCVVPIQQQVMSNLSPVTATFTGTHTRHGGAGWHDAKNHRHAVQQQCADKIRRPSATRCGKNNAPSSRDTA